MTAPTLADFLLARIAEDEEVARAVPMGEAFRVASATTNISDRITAHAVHFSPDRVLAECEAKRQIIADVDGLSGQFYDEIEYRVLNSLAQPYASHPDFREEWRA
jgi:hypothetical protein